MNLREGPFSRLHGVWTFKALTAEACRVELEMDYEMRSGVIAKLMGPVFGQIAQTMVDAFVSRAEALAAGDQA
jgi:ribosome-associated toxin RatA of RatAB toxin-antitoxin module